MKTLFVLIFFICTYASSFSQQLEQSGGGEEQRLNKLQWDKAGQSTIENLPAAKTDYWDSLFINSNNYKNLIDGGAVRCMVSDGDDLYIGGAFEDFEGVRVYNIAHYNKKTKIWSKLDSGVNGTVMGLCISKGTLYACGNFDGIGFNGSTLFNEIISWDGTKWNPVGGGLNGNASAIVAMDSSIIVCGSFSMAGNTSVSNIARWNGHEWDDMGGGLNDNVYSLLAAHDTLFVGGNFYDNTTGLKFIARYVNNTWEPVGEGLDGTVYAIAQYNGDLWAGGDYYFNADETVEMNSLSRWDGTSWNPVGNSEVGTTGGYVNALFPYNGDLYIGGDFSKAGSTAARNIVKYHNGNFEALGSGVYGWVHVIGAFDTLLYVGGSFLDAGGLSVNGIATLSNNNTWSNSEIKSGILGGYTETDVSSIVANERYIFIGGAFRSIAGQTMNGVAGYDKQSKQWFALGNGVDNDVLALALQGSNLYVGGNFNSVGNTSMRHIAYYDIDGKQWHSMGEGAIRNIRTIGVNETGVYASVYFPRESQGFRNHIGRWDGNSWIQLDGSIRGFVYSIYPQGNKLYIGGDISRIDNDVYHNVAEYDGSSWNSMNAAFDNPVLGFTLYKGELYACGSFQYNGSNQLNGIAKWDGTDWVPFSTDLFNNYVLTITSDESNLYAGGRFTGVGGTTRNHIAKWDGSTWSSAAGGASGYVYSLADDNNELIAGGSFTRVGNSSILSYRFGILHFANPASVDAPTEEESIQSQAYPNPSASSEVTIAVTTEKEGAVKIELYSPLGVKIKTIANEIMTASNHKIAFDASQLSAGAYYYRVTTSSGTVTKPIAIVR